MIAYVNSISIFKKKRKVRFSFKHKEMDVKMGYSVGGIQQATENAGYKLVRASGLNIQI